VITLQSTDHPLAPHGPQQEPFGAPPTVLRPCWYAAAGRMLGRHKEPAVREVITMALILIIGMLLLMFVLPALVVLFVFGVEHEQIVHHEPHHQ